MGGREGREHGVKGEMGEGSAWTIHSIVFGVFKVCWG